MNEKRIQQSVDTKTVEQIDTEIDSRQAVGLPVTELEEARRRLLANGDPDVSDNTLAPEHVYHTRPA